MKNLILGIALFLCLCHAAEAKARIYRETAEQDRAAARELLVKLKGDSLQGAEVELILLRAKDDSSSVSKPLPADEFARLREIIRQMQPNPGYIRTSDGGVRRYPWWRKRLVLLVDGQRVVMPWLRGRIKGDTAWPYRDAYRLPDKELYQELRLLIERNAPPKSALKPWWHIF